MNNLLTIKQVAEKLSVSTGTLRRWDRLGKLSAVIINDRGDRRYKPEDIDKFIEGEK